MYKRIALRRSLPTFIGCEKPKSTQNSVQVRSEHTIQFLPPTSQRVLDNVKQVEKTIQEVRGQRSRRNGLSVPEPSVVVRGYDLRPVNGPLLMPTLLFIPRLFGLVLHVPSAGSSRRPVQVQLGGGRSRGPCDASLALRRPTAPAPPTAQRHCQLSSLPLLTSSPRWPPRPACHPHPNVQSPCGESPRRNAD